MDRIADWLCARGFVWSLAEAGVLPAHFVPLCIARQVAELSISWAHVSGRLSINDAEGRSEGSRHG